MFTRILAAAFDARLHVLYVHAGERRIFRTAANDFPAAVAH